MENEKNTQEIVFEILKSGGFVSGASLAKKAGVSRSAVWKAVCSLRKAGWAIEAVTNRGYRLAEEKSSLNAEILRNRLAEIAKDSGITVEFFDSIDSTNNELKRQAASVAAIRDAHGNLTDAGRRLHKKAAVSAEQTAGRGRLGRSFFSGRENGVFMSLLFSPKNGVSDPAKMTANAAVAVCRALSALYGIEAQIKWVNDVFLNGKKICGILTEGVLNLETGLIDAAIVGIGINIRAPEKIPDDIRAVAGFLEDSLDGRTVDKNRLVAAVLSELAALYDAEDADDAAEAQKCLAEYRARSLLTGVTVQVLPVIGDEKTAYTARVVGIADDLALVVESADGERRHLKCGEVSLSSVQIAAKK